MKEIKNYESSHISNFSFIEKKAFIESFALIYKIENKNPEIYVHTYYALISSY